MNEDRPADFAAIVALKHAYFRLLDTKEFERLGELLTEDATSGFDSGRLAFEGRGAIVEFLSRSLGDRGIVTMHTGHHPEIAFTGPGSACGKWYLEDRVIVDAQDFELHGTALYEDEYRREDDGCWRISRTGYRRIFEERRRRRSGEVLSFTTMFDEGSNEGSAEA